MRKSNVSVKAKTNKTDNITMRVKPSEKSKISKYAEKNGMNITEYILNASLNPKQAVKQKKKSVCDLITVQEICNHIEENYGEDEFLERMCEELWQSIQ